MAKANSTSSKKKATKDQVKYFDFSNNLGIDILMVITQLQATRALALEEDLGGMDCMLEDITKKCKAIFSKVDESSFQYTLTQKEVSNV
jgi:hypothetical protein